MTSKLDRILDLVESKRREVTIDVRDLTADQKTEVIRRAQSRGLDAASDGKHVLVRDLRDMRERDAKLRAATSEWLDAMFPNREVRA